MPQILYKILVIQFNSTIYRVSDRGWNGFEYEKWGDNDGYYPLDNEQVEEEFSADEKYKIEMLFDQ
jgi:hypothetical protein